MIEISYLSAVIFISIVWCLARILFAIKNKGIQWKREAQLILVYVCMIVVVRFTFFPFFKVNGEIQPLVFYAIINVIFEFCSELTVMRIDKK